MSEVAAEILGWPTELLLEMDPMRAIAPEDLPRMRERLERRSRGEVGEHTSEIHAVCQDGRRVPIEVTASNVSIGGKAAVFAFFFDASERRASERERLRNEARFRELIENAPEPIGILRDGSFVYANRAYIATLGFSDAQALYATPIAELLGPEENAIARSARRRGLAGAERRRRPSPTTCAGPTGP